MTEQKVTTITLNSEQELPEGADSLNWKVRTAVEKSLENVPTILKNIESKLSTLDPVPELIKNLYLKIDLNEKANEKNQERMLVASERMSKSSETVATGVTVMVEQNKKSNDVTERLLSSLAESFKQQDKNEVRAGDLDKRAEDRVSSAAFEAAQKSSAESLKRAQTNTFISNISLVITVLMFAAFVMGTTLKLHIPGIGDTEISPSDKHDIAKQTAEELNPQVKLNTTTIEKLKADLQTLKEKH